MADVTETIRDNIATLIEGVTGYNAVYKYGRVLRSEEEFVEDFSTGVDAADGHPIGKGWTIQIISIESSDSEHRGGFAETYTARLTCAWSEYNDGESEIAFVAHVNAVKEVLSANKSLLGIAFEAKPAQVISMDYFNWGNRLAHVAIVVYPIDIKVSRMVS